MKQQSQRVVAAFAIWWVMAMAAVAQSTVPDFRFVATPDMDFYGSDLDTLFDTDLDSCVRACAVQSNCQAFTFNSRSSACFPKGHVSQKTPYVGALSAQKEQTSEEVKQLAFSRQADLSFLTETDLSRAVTQAQDLGLRHPGGGVNTAALLESAASVRASGNLIRAMALTGAAISVTDRGDLWADYADLLITIQTDDATAARNFADRALSATVNAFLRVKDVPAQANALLILSQALERTGRGRDMIPALRLAQSLQPGAELDAALDSAIAKYGFRITDSSVDSDAAAPRICAQFSAPLARTGVDYDTFLRMSEAGLAVQVDGAQLCVDGVRHGSRYRLVFRSGLPAADGETLQKNVELIHYVRDRNPAVRFPGRSYVLPRSADAALPIETVNLNTVDLRLRRVSDRNLLRAVQDGYFGRPLSQWEDTTFASDIAEEIWTGTGEVDNSLNEDMTTRLPMQEAIAGQPAGIYALTARVPGADPYDDPGATQWFVLSDLGISSMSGTDGLHVSVRSLAETTARAGVEITLVSRANAVLARAVTDDNGHAQFDPGLTRGTGGAAPALILAAEGDSDVGFLSLTDPAFDLSDRGVEGRAAAGPVDVFLTTDRGAYRAGEVIHATALTRDPEATAIEGLPLMAILRRPDGVEYTRQISEGVIGGHVFALPVAPDAPRGTWRLEVLADPSAPALASQPVLIEDFLPERIDFALALPGTPLRSGDTPALRIDARYLFGAPGADLTIEGQATLRAADMLAAWPGYRFGRHDDEAAAVSSYFGGQRTDAQGQATVVLDLPVTKVGGHPLTLSVTARLADGSARPVERQISAQVLPDTPVIGIKPLFDDVVAEGTDATFEVIALSAGLTPVQMPVRWYLNRVETQYQWYQLYGNWNWEPTTRRTRIASGEFDLTGPLTLTEPVNWGQYELVVEQVGGDFVVSSVDFYAGWYAPADASATPDRLDLSMDRDSYRVGDTARLRIVPRSAGVALISVLSDRVIHREAVAVGVGETVIPLIVDKDWGTGAYVSATVIRAAQDGPDRTPVRALGLAHATVDPVGKVLDVAIDLPDVTTPRQTQPARVTVSGAVEGEEVWLTLAAVDQGILNLTGFQSPDPTGYYFGQRRLGVELRDVYGRLIESTNGALGTVRSGGDNSAGLRMQSPPPTQDLMSTFSGPVLVGPDGEVTVDIDLPPFNGAVRVMIVAWSRTAVGQAETDMVVRDPVVVSASLPDFLAPGDSSRIRLDVTHADGPAGEMTLALMSESSALTLGTVPGSFDLADGDKASFDIPVTAQSVGDPQITVVLGTPDGQELRQTLTLPVRSNDPVIARTRRFLLGAGDSFDFSADVFANLRPDTGRAILSAGPMAKFDAPGLLTALDSYPYGCTEQVASQALPLLYLSSLAQATGLGDQAVVRDKINVAINRILARQASTGAFGLWRAESGDFWLDAYVSDVLSRARAEGYVVPDRAFRMAMDNLRNRISYAADFDKGGQDIAYALMVLAREGAAEMGDLRYYADVKADAFATPLAAAQLGAALANYGDQSRADTMFARAAQLVTSQQADPLVWRADYGTPLRDTAGVLALATEAGSQVIDVADLSNRIAEVDGVLSPQESAWSLLAAQALVQIPEESGLTVNGNSVAGPFVQVLAGDTPHGGMIIRPGDGEEAEITLTTMGVPETPPPAGGTGYTIARSYYTMDGTVLETPDHAVGERFVAVLQVIPFERYAARLMVNDPLPAGVEIDNPALLRSGDIRALDWLEPSVADHTEFRSDRFLAAVDITSGETVTLAYVARAVTPGQYHHPAASVEDMYRPRFRAHTETGQVTVSK